MTDFKTKMGFFREDAKWYSRLCIEAGLMTHGTIKGTMVLQPFGLRIWRMIQKLTRHQLNKFGFQEVAMPTLIAPRLFKMEQQHFNGFGPELFSVSNIKNDIVIKDSQAILRPTSELLFCDYFSKILSQYHQLPLLYYQCGSVFRAEKNTKPFLRNSEFWWLEGHSLHPNVESAETLLDHFIKYFCDFIGNVCLLNFLVGRKTKLEKFAGAETTDTIETILPDGQALQCVTLHYLATNFSKPFGIKYQTKDNIYANPVQTSFGFSSRIIGALVLAHSDERGLLLPSSLNPNPIVVINRVQRNIDWKKYFFKDAAKILKLLPKRSIAIYKTRLKANMDLLVKQGVEFIVIVSPNSIAINEIEIYIRIENKKITLPLDQLAEFMLNKQQNNDNILRKRAVISLTNKIVSITKMEELIKAIQLGKVAKAFFVLNSANETAIKRKTTATIRCIKESSKKGICFYTQKPTSTIVYISKAY